MLSSNGHLTWKTVFLLVLTSARRVSELLFLSICSWTITGMEACAFSFVFHFVAKA